MRRRRQLRLAAAAAMFVGLGAADAAEAETPRCQPSPFGEKRVALVIGNGAYPESGLLTTARGAREMGRLLCNYGFDTGEVKVDLKAADMAATVASLRERASGADQVVVYFAGHGAEYTGESQLLATDWADDATGRLNAVAISQIKRALAETKARAKIIIIV